MSKGAEMVVAHFNRIVEPDGGSIQLVAVEGNVLQVSYDPGTSEECAECVLEPNDLRELIKEALELQDKSITEVELVSAAG